MLTGTLFPLVPVAEAHLSKCSLSMTSQAQRSQPPNEQAEQPDLHVRMTQP